MMTRRVLIRTKHFASICEVNLENEVVKCSPILNAWKGDKLIRLLNFYKSQGSLINFRELKRKEQDEFKLV